jgi:hypothetical protein
MTPAEAADALFKTMPKPVTASQLEEYGIETSDSSAQYIAREILSLNLYWILSGGHHGAIIRIHPEGLVGITAVRARHLGHVSTRAE